jgi:dihydroflavonol-4-reductase
MAGRTKLVVGASGFLGSHVTRQLVERHYGDVFDDEALRSAMDGVDDVFYCVVDTRAWLRDPAPLFRTNVEGLQHVLDTAVDADLHRFVFTSSIGTIGIPTEGRPATEDDEFNWADKGGGYIQSRVAAENRPRPVMHVMSPMDHGKAERELGWRPEPVHDSIEKATHWYRDHRNRSPTAQG